MSMSNPLTKHFRKPVIYVDLPSQGKWYPDGAVKYDAGNEVAVYSMTAMDEILLKSPDALLNGVAVVELIKSCVPGIGDPNDAPIIDIDKLLIAQRIASYGQKMDITTNCPKCNESSTYEVDLSDLLASFKTTNYDEPLAINNISIWAKPISYKTSTRINTLRFNNDKLINGFNENALIEEQQVFYKKLRDSATELTVISIASSIEKIVIDDDIVTNYDYIKDFIKNIDRSTFEKIKSFIESKATTAQNIAEFDVVCDVAKKEDLTCIESSEIKCNHRYKVPFSFDVSNFFAFGS